MEYGTIEREIEIKASPATVFEVLTRPEHLTRWWPDDAVVEATPGATGELVFGDRSSGTAQIPQITVVEAEPPKVFSFRWIYPDGEAARAGNSLLVTFELTPLDDGTLLRMTETGFREKGWEVAVLEQQYREHGQGWDHYLPRLAAYAPTVGVAS
jgi:uncharacterized protein YndB with AHSA1/START domain